MRAQQGTGDEGMQFVPCFLGFLCLPAASVKLGQVNKELFLSWNTVFGTNKAVKANTNSLFGLHSSDTANQQKPVTY